MFRQNYYAQKSASHDFYTGNEGGEVDLMSDYYKMSANNHDLNYHKTVGIDKDKDCYTGCQLELNSDRLAVSM
ncbi:MAG: hypothetical protein ACQEP9_02620 [Bacillota bacterium]